MCCRLLHASHFLVKGCLRFLNTECIKHKVTLKLQNSQLDRNVSSYLSEEDEKMVKNGPKQKNENIVFFHHTLKIIKARTGLLFLLCHFIKKLNAVAKS